MGSTCFKSILILILACFLCLPDGAPAAPKSEETLIVTDDLNRSVAIPKGKLRAAVLLASFADCWLLAGGEVAATVHDAWEDYDLALPEGTVDRGPYNGINLELLIQSGPDFVIASANTKAHVELAESFERMHLPVLFFSVECFEEYLAMLSTLTGITGRADLYEKYGLSLREEIESAKQAAAEAVRASGPQRILILRASTVDIHAKSSQGSVLGAMLRDLGCINIADESGLADSLSLERIIMEDPDRIFVVFQGDTTEAQRRLEAEFVQDSAWAGLSAVKGGRIHYMDKRLYHMKPNSRWGEAYQNLEALLYPEHRDGTHQ